MTRIARLLKPLDEFLRVETASGMVLLAAAGIALALANSGGHAEFAHLLDGWRLPGGLTLHFVVNEILMAVFFLVVGLEIRREVHDGALSTPAQAALPLVAAVGGIVAPALVFIVVADAAVRDGWAIPAATDIAFAVGVLALLGRRVDPALRVLLLAIAIADDIAAVLIIAFFYADGIAPAGLAIAAAGALVGWLGHRAGLNAWLVSLASGAIIWYGFLLAGIHPALAGVAAGLLTPMVPRKAGGEPPAGRLENALHPWVAFGVMPLFALANAGVRFEGLDLSSDLAQGLAGGIALGLAVGKPVGIAFAAFLAVRSGLCALPAGVAPAGIAVIGLLAGIGFTMSIFIAALAFEEPGLLAVAKFGVLAGSVAAAFSGLLLGRLLLRPAAD
jgi:Na+:H+ antiporter, NhaA family